MVRTSEQRRTHSHDSRISSLDTTEGKEKLVADMEATCLKKHIETQKCKNCALNFGKKVARNLANWLYEAGSLRKTNRSKCLL